MLRGKATGNDSSVRFRGKTKSSEEKGPENNDGTEGKFVKNFVARITL